MPEKQSSRKVLFVICVLLFWFANYAFVPTFSTYCADAGASLSAVGIIASAYGLSQLLARVPLGVASDSLGKRKIFISTLGFACIIIAPMFMALFPNMINLFFMRLLTGVSASSWVCFTVLYSSYYDPTKSAKAISVMNMASVIAQMSGNFVGGITADHFGAKAPFWLAAIVGVAGLLLSFFIIEKKKTVSQKKKMDLRPLLAVGKNKKLLTVSLLAAAAQFIAFGAAFTYSPLIAKDLGATDTQLGVLTTLISLAGIPASYLAGTKLVEKFSQKRVILISVFLLAGLCSLYPLVTNVYSLFAVQLLFGFFRYLMFTICMAMSIQSVAPEKRGSAMGFFQAIYSLGIFFGPLVLGYLCDISGLFNGFMITAVMTLFVGIAGFYAMRSMDKTPEKVCVS